MVLLKRYTNTITKRFDHTGSSVIRVELMTQQILATQSLLPGSSGVEN